MLSFISSQIGVPVTAFQDYAKREETRWEHMGEIQAYLDIRPYKGSDDAHVCAIAFNEAEGTDQGEAIVYVMVDYLRANKILLPSPSELERLALTVRARARQKAYEALIVL